MSDETVRDEHAGPHGRHFQHCYAYEGSFCSCGGQYSGDRPGPRLELPATPFNLLAPKRSTA